MNGRTRVAAGLGASVAVATWFLFDRLGRTWGSTRAERAARLAGDDVVASPLVVTDHAATIDAPREQVWPWLVQMGWHRGGWYTARWVDRLLFPANAPSAERIVPELQQLRVGDLVPDGPPESDCNFVVEILDAPGRLLLHSRSHLPLAWRERLGADMDWTWSFALTECGPGRTRFHLRSRVRLAPRWIALAYRIAIPADFVMARQMARGLKSRAERERRSAAPR